MLSKNLNDKKCSPKFVFFNEKNQKDSDEIKWFHLTKAKNHFNFVSLPWKLHNRYCHNRHPSLSQKQFHFGAKREAKYILSSTIYNHDIFRHFFSDWAQDIGKRVDLKYFWSLKVLSSQDPWVTIRDLSKARFVEKKSLLCRVSK